MDLETEILTEHGWKKRGTLTKEDRVISYNSITQRLVAPGISEIIDQQNYSGTVYSLKAKGLDFRVTEGHAVPWFSQDGKRMHTSLVEEIATKDQVSLRRSGIREDEGQGSPLLPDMLRLYILIAADGWVKPETNLVRFRLWEKRKQDYLLNVLRQLQIPYKEFFTGTDEMRTHFYLPQPLEDLKIKGLDPQVLLPCTRADFKVVLEAYAHSKGHKVSPNSWVIYSPKEDEVDLLQAVATQTGFSTTSHKRVGHGFAVKPFFNLIITNKEITTYVEVRSRIQKERVVNEHFWCIRCTPQNFFMRRNGQVHLTGNSHGRLKDIGGLCFDVGVDNWDYYPLSLPQVWKIMQIRDPYLVKGEEYND
jgi:hypothetical protein